MKRLLIVGIMFLIFACNNSTSDSDTLVLKKVQIDSIPTKDTKDNLSSDKDPWIHSTVIDSEGRYFSEDNYEGSNSGYYFYINNDSLIGKYRPYNFFEHSVDCFNDTLFYVAATKNHSSDTIIIASLDHTGNIIIERKISLPKKITLRDMKLSKGGVVLLYHSNNKDFILKHYDSQLNPVWESSSNDFVYYDGLNLTSNYDCIILSYHNQITKLDSRNGEKKWSITPKITPDLKGGYKSKIVLEDKFVALHYFKINESDESFYECSIDLVDINTGQVSYSDSLTDSKTDFKLYNTTELEIGNNEFVVNYEKEIWKYYLQNEN